MQTTKIPGSDASDGWTFSLSSLVFAVFLIAVALVVVWVLAGLVSLGLLAYSVPLLDSDLQNASWLGSPSSALHFTKGYVVFALFFTYVGTGLAISLVSGVRSPIVAGLLMAMALFVGGGERATVRVGILDGTIRIGCYVPESLECKQMLGLPQEGAQSLYKSTDSTAEWAPWYAAKRAALESEDLSFRKTFYVQPCGALLRAPLYLGSADTLKELVIKQRQEVADLKKAATPL